MSMRLYLAPNSSLELIRYLRATNGEEGIGGAPVRKRVLRDAINTVRGVQELDETAQRWLGHVGETVHAYVSDRAKGTSTKRLVTHVLSQAAPNGAFLDLGHGICICSPRFMFMQLAAQLDLIATIQIGMELCGTYTRWRMEQAVMVSPRYRDGQQSRACTYDVPPAMRASKASAFVERLAGMRGAVGARAALRYVLDNSASPQETSIYLQLCLPRRLGGYGLPKPVLNPKVIIRDRKSVV